MQPKSKRTEVEIFQAIKKQLAVIGFTPNQNQNNNIKLSSRQIIFLAVAAIDAASVFSSIFLETNCIPEYMDIIFSQTVQYGVLIAYISLIFKTKIGFHTIKMCDKELTYRSKRNPVSRAMYEKTHRLVEKLCEILYFVITKFGLPGVMLPKAIISYLNYLTTDAGNDAFTLPFPMWLPFNWKSPVGYFFAIIWQSVLTFPIIIFLATVVSLAIGCILFVLSFANDWKNDFRTLGEMVKNNQSKTDVIEQVVEFVRSNSYFKKLFKNFEDLLQVCVFIDVSGCTIAQCAIMLIIQVEIIAKDVIDPGILGKSIILFFISFGLVFLSCEIGQLLTNTTDDVEYELGQLDWYLFPIEVQRILPTILIGVQEPVAVDCFGIIELNREQLKKVTKAVYNSFNVLRQVLN